ncbi:hypothetical protein KKE19_03495 [Patescibacteria group bacterium]|nr:hypothetical protein [Patescibacteria group bacterium]MBU4367979.1 hypothetical protein [Patescibacteria group bacterium]MBU4462160.1 hypothetical protein [Patescibacteria group bacterium]MCG2699822.1 hypothetical protein [Candidatus Parcubacteria bacterium]
MVDNILVLWLFWHFYEMPKFLLQVWKNFILFAINFFSTPLLLKTLFSPWRRYNWSYPRGFDIRGYLETIISNFFSRFLGAICRIVLIIIGSILQIFVVIVGAIIFLGWLILPLLVLIGLLFVLTIL